MIPHIILITQEQDFKPIAFVEELCICDGDGNVIIFPDFESAFKHHTDNCIDGCIIPLPII
tara:strand:+ start:499 stop:681 length:183 start_codon:yes stop_codon:yes gene_type:complete